MSDICLVITWAGPTFAIGWYLATFAIYRRHYKRCLHSGMSTDEARRQAEAAVTGSEVTT
ncbi:MAG: hypothetical protein GY772_20315 [bacterium]|nr:hypothetical protein [bacterium]